MRRMRHLKPREIQGCTLALDASIATSLYDATTGGSLVAADGQVARWEDQSGSGNHVTQATAGLRFLRRVAARGGQDAVQSSTDAASLMATSAFYPSSAAGDVTVISVGMPDTAITRSCIWFYGQASNGKCASWYPRFDTSRGVTAFLSSYIGRSGSPTEVGAWHAHSYLASAATQIVDTSQRINMVASSENYTSNPTTALNIGTGIPFQVSANTNKMGYAALVAAYNRALGQSVLARIEAAAMRKWRING